ncbi:patatin-like phospholipase family protein [Emcibacter sp. SYSU 3D8]|uniref:patatin-like phospholipase family protein n=1 Tax=Emcibacter sp. SYSU 3D8 TaxID=3133969 RepID=UPI0031FE72FF
MQKRKPAPETFELGLVMAGAVSAGAYTAGVLDFLFEALGEWEAAKLAALNGGPAVPDHKVVIRASSGASAGGIASALVAMVPFTGHTPVRSPQDKAAMEKNLFYKCWVTDIDLADMLGTKDISKDGQVYSLLDGTSLDIVAANLAKATRKAIGGPDVPKPGWIANPLQLYLSIANLRGVPYLIQMVAADPVRGHRVLTHGDYAHFAVSGTGNGKPEAIPVAASPVNFPGTQGSSQDGWERLLEAALSTSAFPVGLPARRFRNSRQLYDAKIWARPGGAPDDGTPPTVSPDMKPAELEPVYDFWTVDGGVVNNEPLEFARIALSGAPDERNPRDPVSADRALLMIDPFPDDEGRAHEMGFAGEKPDMFSTALNLLGTMKRQARFRPDEIMLALHENVYSRFLIAPTRGRIPEGQTHIASAGLGGFAGFLNESLRSHDFFLGRRNCQQFLRTHLAIHKDNPIVHRWTDAFETAGNLTAFRSLTKPMPNGPWVADQDFVQLIPLVGTAAEECKAPAWPRLDYKRDVEAKLKSKIANRAGKVSSGTVKGLLKNLGMGEGAIGDLVGWIARSKLKSLIKDRALEAIKKDLGDRGLLS